MCELPLLQSVAGLTRAEAQRLGLRPRLQAHVIGHVLRHEVLRLDRDKNKGNEKKKRKEQTNYSLIAPRASRTGTELQGVASKGRVCTGYIMSNRDCGVRREAERQR